MANCTASKPETRAATEGDRFSGACELHRDWRNGMEGPFDPIDPPAELADIRLVILGKMEQAGGAASAALDGCGVAVSRQDRPHCILSESSFSAGKTGSRRRRRSFAARASVSSGHQLEDGTTRPAGIQVGKSAGVMDQKIGSVFHKLRHLGIDISHEKSDMMDAFAPPIEKL